MNKEEALIELIRTAQSIIRLRKTVVRTGALEALQREESLFIQLIGKYQSVLTLGDLIGCETIRYMLETTKVKGKSE